MVFKYLLYLFFIAASPACDNSKFRTELVVHSYLKLYYPNGQLGFTGKDKLWQRDSLFIMQVYVFKAETDTGGKTSIKYIPKFCRFVDLKAGAYYDYLSFSDTAVCFSKNILPDSQFIDGYLPFYSEKRIQIEGIPLMLTDTVIDARQYKRARFYTKGYDSLKTYSIGLFPVDMPFSVLSIEKRFSRSNNWFLMKMLDYNINAQLPHAVSEIEILSEKLSVAEHKIFNTWEKYAREHPVNK